ncbi:MAG: RnfABCDGE type electron transport complex subunit D [Gammaproteobacteria bacterium]|nr:RnfABCDGE type electron transport complex subunit D [Gammaproteobacteria bacterium]
MVQLKKTLEITTSPHIFSANSVESIMRNVIYAILPAAFFGVYVFGISALLLLVTAVLSCVLSEYLLNKFSRSQTTLTGTIRDGSVLVTGLLYGMTLPPGLPLWMVCVGGFIAVGLGKFIFGGLGYNVFNPALVGRAFLQAAFPVSMTTWMPALDPERFHSIASSTLAFPFTTPVYDSVSSATPLALMKFEQQLSETSNLFFGLTSGSAAETGSLLILLGGLYLIARKMMNWRIPAGIFIAVIVLSGIFHLMNAAIYPSPVFMLFSGGLMLGAMFMATDMVASPVTAWGCFVYGLLIGSLVVVIRLWGGMPEGVMYAILFANALSPHLDRLIQPVPYGMRKGQ